MILHEIFRVVSQFPSYISCYIAESRFPLGQCGTEAYFIFEHRLGIECTRLAPTPYPLYAAVHVPVVFAQLGMGDTSLSLQGLTYFSRLHR